jgi:hypothetical protein
VHIHHELRDAGSPALVWLAEGKAKHNDRFSRADKDEAKGKAGSHSKDSEKERGGGTASINGTASAIPGGTCIIAGARPGVDGPWRMEEVSHSYSRSGWTTDLTLKMPGDKKDTRTGKG